MAEKHFRYCGAFGRAVYVEGVQREPGRFCNWKNCKNLSGKMSEGPQGKYIYPICSKGYWVDYAKGANLGRIFRGKSVSCKEYEEGNRGLLVTREELKAIDMSDEEIIKIVGM